MVKSADSRHLQRKAAVLLAAGFTQEQVGREIKRTDRTVRAWLTRDDFNALVEHYSAQLDIALYDDASGMLMESFRFYRRFLRGEVEPDDDRVASVERIILRWMDRAFIDAPPAGNAGPQTAQQFNIYPPG